MKKLLAILLVAIMALTLFACDKKPVDPQPTDPAAPTESSGEPAGKVYKVINLVNGNLGDKSFFDSAEAGLKRLADAGRHYL